MNMYQATKKNNNFTAVTDIMDRANSDIEMVVKEKIKDVVKEKKAVTSHCVAAT